MTRTHIQEVAHHYDALDSYYRAIWGDRVHHGLWRNGTESRDEAVVELVREVARTAGLRPGARVCDVGCGYGATSRWLADTLAADVLGVTISKRQYERARAKERPGLRFRKVDWFENGLPSRSFDHVIAIESTEHMSDLRRCFAEAFRVLRPGGTLVVCAWLSASDPKSWERRRLLDAIRREGRLAHLTTADEYVALMSGAGFREVQARDLTKAVERTWSAVIRKMVAYLARRPSRLGILASPDGVARDGLRMVLRILLAYRTGAMEYAIFRAVR